MDEVVFRILTVAPPAVLAITLHEAAHGWAAWRLGDDTAMRMGRVTCNPFRHIDPFGTVVLPALIEYATGYPLGWAKPVPVNFERLRRPRRDVVLIAIAGPGVNLILATVSAWLWTMAPAAPVSGFEFWWKETMRFSIFANVVLMTINMLPLPPLDGGRVAVGILPGFLARPLARLENVGLPLLIGALFLLPLLLREFGVHFSPMEALLGPPVDWAVERLVRMVGGF